MSFTPAQLASEINNDPASLGYSARVAAGDDAGVAAILNAATATKVFRNDIGIREVINAIAAADFAAATALQIAKLQVLFAGSTTLDATSSNTRSIVLGIFAGATTTVNALTALSQRNGSRAEVLWGVGTAISGTEVSLALRGAS